MEAAALKREERRLSLRRWGFLCSCEVCSLSGEQLDTDERLRDDLNILKGKLRECETDVTNIPSLQEQERLETEILRLLRSLSDSLLPSLPSQLMSLHHVSKLLAANRQRARADLAALRSEAKDLATKLGPPFLQQFYYWENLTSKCCASVKRIKRKHKR